MFSYYDEDYLLSVSEENFKSVYTMFCKYKFYFVKDIIVNYLEIFTLNCKKVEDKIIKLIEMLGNNYNYIIGNDMSYLDYIIEK